MPAATVDSTVANAPGQRLAQPPPPAAQATTNLLPSSSRPKWDAYDCDLLLKFASRPQFTEASGVRIRAFLENAENCLDMCKRPRDRWARFIISLLGVKEAEKVRRSHFCNDDVDYTAFKTGLITLFGRLEFEDSNCQQLRELANTGSESIALYAARTTDLTSRAYPKFSTENQLEIAVKYFIAGLRNTSTRDYLRREREHRSISCQEAVQMAQACELPAPQNDVFFSPQSRVTRRTRRSQTPHRAPRRQATIAQSRRHAHLGTTHWQLRQHTTSS